jgi:signal transduction histidine kinase
MKRASLFVRYWASLALLVTLPIVASGVIEGWTVYRAGYATANERQIHLAREAALAVEQKVRPPIDRLEIAAGVPWDYPGASGQFEIEMRRILRQFPVVDRVQRVSADGQVIAFYSADGAARALTQPELDEVRRQPAVEPPSGKGAVWKRRPVTPVSRGTPGAWSVVIPEITPGRFLVSDLHTETMEDAVGELAEWGDKLMFVVDRTGALLLAHTDISFGTGKPVTALAGWQNISGLSRIIDPAGPKEGSLGEISVQVSAASNAPENWFAAYRRIEPLGWTVFALAPSAGLQADIRAAVTRTALIVLSANVVALLLALAFARQMSRPLESLAQASQRVAQGDLGAHAEVMSDDDIGRVSRQFNAMVDELRRSYAELEDRVAEKTAELAKANRHKSEFLAQMSHELRTPLNAIIGFSQNMADGITGSLTDKQAAYVKDILASGEHLLALINDLLDLAKIEAGRMDLAPSSVDVAHVLDEAWRLVRERAHAHGITFTSNVEPAARKWTADERKLKQVVLNLLSNAVKFTSDGGTVDVGVTRRERDQDGGRQPELLFRISDTGIGIPPDQVSKLFTDFGQIARQEASTREGTGLGLALSRRLVELHGGRIWAESEPGRGSTFYFTLPERP